MIVYGIHAVAEALRAGYVTRIRIARHAAGRIGDLLRDAQRAGVAVERVDASVLDRVARGEVHQGIVAETRDQPAYDLDALIAQATYPALLLVLDGIEDPQNLGAIVRTADAAGVYGIVRQERHAAALGPAAAKASAGALAHARIASVVNIARALERLKDANVWTVGLAGEADRPYDEVDLTAPVAIVMGAEGTGLRRLVREKCDWLVSIPMHGHVSSLNVSVATGIVLYEVLRQRRGRASRP